MEFIIQLCLKIVCVFLIAVPFGFSNAATLSKLSPQQDAMSDACSDIKYIYIPKFSTLKKEWSGAYSQGDNDLEKTYSLLTFPFNHPLKEDLKRSIAELENQNLVLRDEVEKIVRTIEYWEALRDGLLASKKNTIGLGETVLNRISHSLTNLKDTLSIFEIPASNPTPSSQELAIQQLEYGIITEAINVMKVIRAKCESRLNPKLL